MFLRVSDVEEILGVSESYAYKLIRKLNKEMQDLGFQTIQGRIDTKFFYEHFYQTQNYERRDDYTYELSNNYKYCGYNFTWGILISIFGRMPYGAICHNEGKQNRYAEGVSMFCLFYSIRPKAF